MLKNGSAVLGIIIQMYKRCIIIITVKCISDGTQPGNTERIGERQAASIGDAERQVERRRVCAQRAREDRRADCSLRPGPGI